MGTARLAVGAAAIALVAGGVVAARTVSAPDTAPRPAPPPPSSSPAPSVAASARPPSSPAPSVAASARPSSSPAAAPSFIPTPPPSERSAAELERQGCAACHLQEGAGPFLFASYRSFQKTPPIEPAECARCHINNLVAALAPRPAAWLPIGAEALSRVRRFHAYVDNPPVALLVDAPAAGGARARLARFTACGLDRFLAAPVSRRNHANQAMYPIQPDKRQALLAALAPDLAPCEERAATAAEVERGRHLYATEGCALCHTGNGPGPRLRLGLPLLSREYVDARVRYGTEDGAPSPIWQRAWAAEDGVLVARPSANAVVMPAHPTLNDAALDALYAYIVSDHSDVPAPPSAAPATSIAVSEDIRLPLYREVQRRVFDTTCRHCHSDEPAAQQILRGVFGSDQSARDGAPLQLPMSRLPTPSESRALRAVLEPGPGCSESRLIARLRARAREWSGEHSPDAPRGMPLTMPPLAEDVIHLAEIWTAAGCPSDVGDLCSRCAPRAHAARMER